jgi:hypothetical protein
MISILPPLIFECIVQAHHIKNFKSQRWQTLLSFKSVRRLLLTGTPLQNNLMELWSLMHFLMPNIFASQREFKEWFNPVTSMIEGKDKASQVLIDRLHAILRPFLLRRLKQDVAKQLPPKIEHTILCRLSKRQRGLYDEFIGAAETKATMRSGGYLGLMNIVMQLRKVCNHPDLFAPRPIFSPLDWPACEFSVPRRVVLGLDAGDTSRSSPWTSTVSGPAIGQQPSTAVRWNRALVLVPPRPSESTTRAPDAMAVVTSSPASSSSSSSSSLASAVAATSPEECHGVVSWARWLPVVCAVHALNLPRYATQRIAELQLSAAQHVYQAMEHETRRLAHATSPFYPSPFADAAQARAQKYLHHAATDLYPPRAARVALFTGLTVAHNVYPSDLIAVVHRPLCRRTTADDEEEVDVRAMDTSSSSSSSSSAAASAAGASTKLSTLAARVGRDSWTVQNVHLWATKSTGSLHGHAVTTQSTAPILRAGWASTPQALLSLIQLPATRLMKMQPLLDVYTCIIPKARVTAVVPYVPTILLTPLLPSHDAQDTMVHALAPAAAPYHASHVRQQLYFPDKRLLQYDCGKLQALCELLNTLKAGGHRCLIFTQMTKMLDILEQFINMYQYKYLRLDGSTKVEDRQKLMERFNTDPRLFLFILSTRSGGVGINLTGADTVIFYDSDWNPAIDAQAQDRCHRIGQTRDVHIYRLISQATIEENILKKAYQKRHLDAVVIGDGKFTTDSLAKSSTSADTTQGLLGMFA